MAAKWGRQGRGKAGGSPWEGEILGWEQPQG